MTTTSYILGIAAPAAILIAVVVLLRRGRMRERHAAWWIAASLVALGFGIFPGALATVAELAGVAIPLNIVFFGGIAVLFLVSVQHSGELTRLEDRLRILTERLALLELDAQGRESKPKKR